MSVLPILQFQLCRIMLSKAFWMSIALRSRNPKLLSSNVDSSFFFFSSLCRRKFRFVSSSFFPQYTHIVDRSKGDAIQAKGIRERSGFENIRFLTIGMCFLAATILKEENRQYRDAGIRRCAIQLTLSVLRLAGR